MTDATAERDRASRSCRGKGRACNACVHDDPKWLPRAPSAPDSPEAGLAARVAQAISRLQRRNWAFETRGTRMSDLVALGREIHPSVGRAGRGPGRDEAASAQRGGMPRRPRLHAKIFMAVAARPTDAAADPGIEQAHLAYLAISYGPIDRISPAVSCPSV
jgi:hypothetical protein